VSYSFRYYWPDPVSSGWMNINAGVVRQYARNSNFGAVSAVVMTASEYKKVGRIERIGIIGEGVQLWRGDAEIWVSNVRPYIRNLTEDPNQQNGGIEFYLHVGYHTPLLVATTVTILDGSPSLDPGGLVEVL
jgi:hypothetical protein